MSFRYNKRLPGGKHRRTVTRPTVGSVVCISEISSRAWLSISEDRTAASDLLRRMISYFGPYLKAAALATVGLTPRDFATISQLMDTGNYEAAMRTERGPRPEISCGIP